MASDKRSKAPKAPKTPKLDPETREALADNAGRALLDLEHYQRSVAARNDRIRIEIIAGKPLRAVARASGLSQAQIYRIIRTNDDE